MNDPKYVIRYTDAPESYDGFGTRTVPDVRVINRKTRHGKLRAVMVDMDHLGWQKDRNYSGNFLLMQSDELDIMERAGAILDDEGESDE